MSVSEQVPYQRFVGNGSTTDFALPFGTDDGEYIKVTVDGETHTYGGTYTVEDIGDTVATVVFTDPPAVDADVVVWRETPINRITDYIEHGPRSAAALNGDLDRIIRIVQENAARYDRLLDANDDINLVADNIEDIEAAAALINVRTVDTIDDLRDVDHSVTQYCHVLGYYHAGDGGGGLYYYDTTPGAENGGTIVVADDNGTWRLQTNHVVSVKQFGAKGDDVEFDDQPYIQSCIEWAKANGTKVRRIRVPLGIYHLYDYTIGGISHLTLSTAVGLKFEGDGCLYGSVLKAMSTDKHLIDVTGSSISCMFENIKFDRDYSEIGGYTVSKAIEGADGIHFHGSWNNPMFFFNNCIISHHYTGLRTSTARMLSSTWVGCSFLNNTLHGVHLSMNNEERFLGCISNSNGFKDVAGVRTRISADGEYGAGWRIGNKDKVDGAASVGGVYLDSPTTWGNGGHGVHLEGADNQVYPASAIQITNGFLDSSGGSGLFVQFAWGVHVSSTKFSWNDQRGCHIGFGVTEVTIAGSTAHDNVLEGFLIYGSAKNVTLSGCQAISNNRNVVSNAYGIRIVGPCEDIHIMGGSSGNGPPVLTNGGYPGDDPPDSGDYTIPRDCQYGGIRIEKYAGADSPREVYIHGVSFPDMDPARLITYSPDDDPDTTVGNEIYTDLMRDWTPEFDASTPGSGMTITVNEAHYRRTGPDMTDIFLRFTIDSVGSPTPAAGAIHVTLPVESAWQAGSIMGQDKTGGDWIMGLPYGDGMWIKNAADTDIVDTHTYSLCGTYRSVLLA